MTNHTPCPDRAQFEAAAARLVPIEREVLMLSAGEDLELGAIAARLGISIDAAAGHLADALYNLHRLLDEPGRPWWRFWRG